MRVLGPLLLVAGIGAHAAAADPPCGTEAGVRDEARWLHRY